MDRNTLIGVVAGIGIAAAGGAAGFAMMGQSADESQTTGAVADIAEEAVDAAEATLAEPVAAAPAPAPARAPAPAPARATATVAQPSPVNSTPAPEPVAARTVECWEEEVEVPAEARDDKRIAGTAAGALIGGALADRIGDDDDLVTAAGAAAGAFIGRRAQREFQENRTTTTTVTRCSE